MEYDASFLNCKFEAPNAVEEFNPKALSFLKYAFNPHNYHTKKLKEKEKVHFQNTYYKSKSKEKYVR